MFAETVAAYNTDPSADYVQQLAQATSWIERATMVFVMVFFGFALSYGLLHCVRPLRRLEPRSLATAGLTVLFSNYLYGVTTPFAISRLVEPEAVRQKTETRARLIPP